MTPLPGFVYFDKDFIFPDGDIKEKLFVVLRDSPKNEANVLVARTTSKSKSESSYGCHSPSKFETVFFVPQEDGIFHEDTWVLFDYLSEYDQDHLSRWKRIGVLNLQQTKDMLNCASESYTLAIWQKDALEDHASLIKI